MGMEFKDEFESATGIGFEVEFEFEIVI